MTTTEPFEVGERAMLERIAGGAPLASLLDGIVELIESQAEGMMCSILLVDLENGCVRHGAAPSLPAEYSRALDGVKIGPQEGSCGAAASLGRRVIVEDIATHPNWALYKSLALPHGLLACWSSPIFSPAREVLGTFAMYYSEPRGPTDREVEWVDAATHLASIAILRERWEQSVRRTEQALRRSEERLRAVVEHTPNVAIQWYDENARVVLYNEASRRMFGWVGQSAVGRTLGELGFPATEAEKLASAIRDVKQGGQPVGPAEFHFQHPDGTPGVLLSTVFEVPKSDDGARFVCMDVDITPRKRAEEERRMLEAQLHQSQRMQSLGTLAGGIAHDFNNILAAIRGNTDLALHELPEGHPARQSVVEIGKASRRATELVRQILTFGRREEPRREPVRLRSVIEEALRLLRATLPSSIRIEADLSASTPAVFADSTQIHQVVMNLGTNAAHAIGTRGGVIAISSGALDVGPEQAATHPRLAEGRYARVSVRDDGRGMDAATAQRVFEPFFTTKAPGVGLGLGLSVVHGIIESHEGAITVESELARGTTFVFYLPAADVTLGETLEPRAITLSGLGEHILYVDDEEALVHLAKRSLTRLGYRVTGHSDPTRALLDFRARPTEFDVVITDIAMPRLTGHELARELLAIRADVLVVMTSGFVRPEDAEAARELGINDVVPKPSTVQELGQVLHRLLSARRGSVPSAQ
ncbi:MAG: response regulator [Deltaproteobacteria bacterium]|nr:response regulator [Deltaproteobacteria bacterium]